MNSFDIIIFGVLTIFLVMRLWNVLGQRDDDPDSSDSSPKSLGYARDEDNIVILPARKTPAAPLGADITIHGFAAASLAGGLDQIRCADPTFDEKTFLLGAKIAFEHIVYAFASGDLSSLKQLLAPDVYSSFSLAVEARHMAGHKLETKILRIKDTDLDGARMEGSRAFLTVRFVSEQINIIRDANLDILSGHENEPEDIEDTWVFARDTKNSDPNWQLMETRNR